MTDLHTMLSRLGLAQYTERFSEEGFETWETVLDITESDLDALGVKLGHRRMLQREIAYARGVSVEQLSTTSRRSGGGASGGVDENKLDGKTGTETGAKRKYRRHPKASIENKSWNYVSFSQTKNWLTTVVCSQADEHAPERPPSAYVLFSNRIREELKSQNLSFTDIAKRVGERWQDLSAAEKEPYETQASLAKEKYHSGMGDYKTTKSYRDHQHYLAEFKAKNAPTADGKRPKLTQVECITSSGDIGSPPGDAQLVGDSTEARQRRADSTSSGGPHSTSGLPSPASVGSGPSVLRGNLSSIIPLGNASPTSPSSSKSSTHRESSIGPLLQGSQTYTERVTALGSGQPLPRMLPLDSKGAHTEQGTASWPFTDPRLSRGQTSPLGKSRLSARNPSTLVDNTSNSSKSSTGSTLSSNSTAASSTYSSVTLGDAPKTAMTLPSRTTARLNSTSRSSHADPAARSNLQPLATRTASSFAPHHSSYSLSNSSSSAGMKFESLQLPLPHNVSFGQHPLPRRDGEGKLANIFDLQDIPQERNSFRQMTFEQEQSTSAHNPTMSPIPPNPQHPPHHPVLPSLPSTLRHDTQDHFPSNADPLSVLAYAGRLVGRENHPSP